MNEAMSVRRINYRSDFDFVSRLFVTKSDGTLQEIGFPAHDWELFIRRTSGSPFVASSKNGVQKNCFNDGGLIHVVCQDHEFVPGRLFADFRAYLPNPLYPDGVQLVVSRHLLDIELVEDNGDDAVALEAQLQLPVIAVGGGGVDSTLYLSKVEASKIYQPKGDYALKSDLPQMPEVPTKVSELENDSEFVTAQELAKKQDTLIPGEGINITDGRISCTLDTSLYVVVSELPSVGVANKIYLIESNESGEQNIYTEYGYINGKWEKLGQYRAEINLEPYLTKESAQTTYQPKGDYALRKELPEVPTKVSELENDEDFVKTGDLPESETYVLDFTIADGVNTGTFTAEQYNPLRAAIEAGKLIIIGGKVTRVTADSQAMAADYVVIRYATPRISDDNKSVTFSVYELKFSATEYTSKAIHKVIS